MTKQAARQWIRNNITDHTDTVTGEVDLTSLAEGCAHHFDADHVGGPLDDETHWLWELAVAGAQ